MSISSIRLFIAFAVFFAAVQGQYAVSLASENSNGVEDRYITGQNALLAKNRAIKERYTFYVLGTKFIGLPGVFSPQACGEDGFFVKHLPIRPGEFVLEIGSGTGFFAVFAARKGAAKVVATDISPEAVNNIAENAKLHSMESKIEAIKSDIFNSIPTDKKFDVIYWNIPFTPTSRSDLNMLDLTVFDPGHKFMERYFSEGGNFLKPKGRLYLGYSSTHGDVVMMKKLARKYKWSVRLLGQEGSKDTIVVQLYEFQMQGQN